MRQAVLRSTLLVCLAAACGPAAEGKYTLTVSKAGTGAGTVAATGIACGDDCFEEFGPGASVTLTATHAAGSKFASWSGCGTTSGASCTVELTEDRAVTATFDALPGAKVDADIDVATTWESGKAYEVTKRINVRAPLTLQPGVVVRFDAGASLVATSPIVADGGSAASPIVFTSAAASPAGGDWGGITITASGSTFRFCEFRYAGADDAAALALSNGASATVTNCTFAHHRTPTQAISSTAALDASEAGAATIIRDNLFYDDGVPLSVGAAFSLLPNAFDNAAAAPDAPRPSTYNGVFVEGCAHVTSAITWAPLPVPYVVGNPNNACNYLVVDRSASLALGTPAQPAIVKFFPSGRIDVNGTIAARAVFTSVKDDAFGGDSNGDAASTTPAGGDWSGLDLNSSGSIIEGSVFRFTGADDEPAVSIGGGLAATVTGTTFAHHGPPNQTIRSAPALDAIDAAGASVLRDNVFYGGIVPLALNTTLSIDDSNTFTGSDAAGGPTLGNRYQAIVARGCGHVTTNVTWASKKVPVVVGDPDTACGYVVVDANGQLTVADGVTVKFFPGGNLDVNGRLVADAATGVWFTSFRDDAHGGDTNADGAASAAAGGDWNGISLGASGSVFNRAHLIYGGGATEGDSVPVLRVESSRAATITNCVFAHVRTAEDALTAPPALDLTDASPAGLVLHDNVFFDDTLPLGINARLSIDDTNRFDSGVAGEPQPSRYDGILVAGCGHVTSTTNWLATKVPLVIGDPNTACNYLVVDKSAHLTLGATTVLKFFPEGRIEVAAGGTLTIPAGAALTSIADDRLGDTNADGSASTPYASDWAGVKYNHATGPDTCDHAAYMHYETADEAGRCAW